MENERTEDIHWDEITPYFIEQAMDEIDREGVPANRRSRVYHLEARGKRYPPKYVIGLAYKRATGETLAASDFGGGEGGANDTLRKLKYTVVPNMERIEKTVFLSYRRIDISWALAIFEDLTHHGYDVFFDFNVIGSGDFERIIVENIKARAHFLVLLTPSALRRCRDAADWLRREIEVAIDNRRNIVPIMLAGLDLGAQEIGDQLSGKLAQLKNYNGLNVPSDFFPEAMQRLRDRYLNVPLDTVLHPVSIAAQQAARTQHAEAVAAFADKPVLGSGPRQKSMEELLASCENKVAVEFFQQRSYMPTNKHKNALAYRQGGKIHWYVWPTAAGAAVLQINHFKDDEAIWSRLSNPQIRLRTSVGRANLRFDLISSSDFDLFTQNVEKSPVPTSSWVKPQRVRAGL